MKKLLIIFTLLLSFNIYSQDFDYQKECKDACVEVETFWSAKFAKRGLIFISPKKSFYSQNNPIQTSCGNVSEPNAFYCPADNSVSLSHDLFNNLAVRYNDNGLFYFIIGHEYGHLVQNQSKMDIPLSVMKELDADCLAGIFYNNLEKKGIVEQKDITAIYGFLTDFSTNGAGWGNLTNPQAHGDGDTRFLAFSKGYQLGTVQGCSQDYAADPDTQRLAKSVAGLYQLFKGN